MRTQFAAYLRPRRVNAARMILCALKKRAAEGSALKSRKNDLSAQIIFREPKQFKARLKTTLFKKRTQFAAYLRSQRVNAARMLWGVPSKSAPQRAEPSKSRKNDLSAQIIFREHKHLFAQGKSQFSVAHPYLATLCLTERVKPRDCVLCVPLNIARRGESRSGFPSNHENSQASARRDLRESKRFTARLKTALFKKRTRFAAMSGLPKKSECENCYNRKALKLRLPKIATRAAV